jgi:hypothetical protein
MSITIGQLHALFCAEIAGVDTGQRKDDGTFARYLLTYCGPWHGEVARKQVGHGVSRSAHGVSRSSFSLALRSWASRDLHHQCGGPDADVVRPAGRSARVEVEVDTKLADPRYLGARPWVRHSMDHAQR